jgi:hypothetical protein
LALAGKFGFSGGIWYGGFEEYFAKKFRPELPVAFSGSFDNCAHAFVDLSHGLCLAGELR